MALSKMKVLSSMLMFLDDDDEVCAKMDEEIELNIINLMCSLMERRQGVRNFNYVEQVG